MKFWRAVLEDTLGLVYPNVCVTCGKSLPQGCRYLCPSCLYRLPRTHFHKDPDNPLAMVFWGRVRIEQAAAWFHYTKGSRYPQLIHAIKYSGRTGLGMTLGRLYGAELKESPFAEARLIVPVPLHPRKQRKRGFNQSECIGRGLARALQIPLVTTNLWRTVNTKSQTRQTRLERWKNVENVFRLRDPEALQEKHVLLVDDVVTTGATLESCAGVLLGVPGTRVSIVALGYATL